MNYENKKFIRQHGLTEAVKRFQQINEYTFVSAKPALQEDGDEEDNNQQQQPTNQQQSQGQQPVQQGGNMGDMNANPTQGNQQPDMNGGNAADPNMGNGNIPPMPDNGAQQGMNTNADPNMDMGNGGDAGFEDIDMEGGDENDDEVIDVDDLTQSQENSEFKIEQMQAKLDSLAQLTQSFMDAIDASDRHIEDLKSELEQRIPTDKEKLDIRSQAGAPFSENPTGYWQDKAQTNPNYEVSFENNDPTAEAKPIDIKMSEITGANDKEVYDSFSKFNKLTDFVRF